MGGERMSGVSILGISAYYHDSAAALIRDGEIVAAAQEERFSRVKGDEKFPHHAIGFCLDQAGLHEEDVDYIVFYEDSMLKFERLLTMYHVSAPFSFKSFVRAMPSWLTRKLWLRHHMVRELGVTKGIYTCEHHLSHAASAFFPSPFADAAILTVDGVGEWATATYGTGHGNRVEIKEQIRFPNSLGLLYSAFTYYTGFKVNSGEYKLMGLAPYGVPRYVDLIRKHLISVCNDGSFVLNQRYFNYVGGLAMTNRRFHDLFGGPPRKPESEITRKEMDIAASIQDVINHVFLAMAETVHQRTGMDDLALAGGVALNVVAAGVVSTQGPFRRIWTQPAAGDAGGALGAALWMWHQQLGHARTPSPIDSMHGAFLGPNIPTASASDDMQLEDMGAVWKTLSDEALQDRIVERLIEGDVVAVARGRMEFGPRALGSRSILADARLPHMQRHINLKVKLREGFRPFAPMVLAGDAGDFFEMRQESPYMLLVYPVAEAKRREVSEEDYNGLDLLNIHRSEIPAVTHVDYSARIQTVDAQRNPFIHGLLAKFKERTGCPLVVNTSFNLRGEPIVNSVEDAYRCFMATHIDCLVVGNRFLSREANNNEVLTDDERTKWVRRFRLD
jgi:carbamoyltransferase